MKCKLCNSKLSLYAVPTNTRWYKCEMCDHYTKIIVPHKIIEYIYNGSYYHRSIELEWENGFAQIWKGENKIGNIISIPKLTSKIAKQWFNRLNNFQILL